MSDPINLNFPQQFLIWRTLFLTCTWSIFRLQRQRHLLDLGFDKNLFWSSEYFPKHYTASLSLSLTFLSNNLCQPARTYFSIVLLSVYCFSTYSEIAGRDGTGRGVPQQYLTNVIYGLHFFFTVDKLTLLVHVLWKTGKWLESDKINVYVQLYYFV